jgi:hypothetical protein
MSQHKSLARTAPAVESSVRSSVLQQDAGGPGPEVMPSIVNDVLPWPGGPSDEVMERHLGGASGRDFSQVPVHTAPRGNTRPGGSVSASVPRVGAVTSPLEAEAKQISARLATADAPIGSRGSTAVDVSKDSPRPATLRGPGEFSAPAAAVAVLGRSGRPLTGAEQAFFGPRLGFDLSPVRLHTGPAADSAVKSVDAKAFAVGEHIVLGSRHWSQGSTSGRKLLAHELAHVGQYRRGHGDAVLRREPESSEQELRQQILENERQLADQSLPPEEVTRLNAERNALLARLRPGQSAAPAAPAGGPRPHAGPQTVPVEVTYELVRPVEPGAPIGGSESGGFTAEGLTADTSAASGQALLRFLDPLPGSGAPGAPNVYTRFVGPETAEGFFEPGRLSGRGDLRPRLYQTGQLAEREAAFALFRQRGISFAQLSQLSRQLRAGGVSALTQEQAAVLRVVTEVHATVSGATPHSPLISLTELEPAAALERLPKVGTQRAWLVRVRISPNDVIRVNDILRRTGQGALAAEQEIVVAMDLASGTGARGPQILSITANQAQGAPLAGRLGAGLRWTGRALIVVGAALTVHEVVTAKGPHRRETQGRAFGGFAGATAVGAFGAGLCIGLGVATAGVGLALCGLGFGIAGMLGGSWAGGRIGRAFD